MRVVASTLQLHGCSCFSCKAAFSATEKGLWFSGVVVFCCRILCEVHEEYETNIRLAERGYWVSRVCLLLRLSTMVAWQ